MNAATLRRTLLLALVAVAVAVPVIAGPATPPASAGLASMPLLVPGVHVKSQQYNICSAYCTGPTGANGRAWAVWNFVGQSAWTLSLNEACLSDMNYVSSGVSQAYDAQIADSSVTACADGTVPWFGNAVVTAGGRRPGGPVQYQFNSQSTSPCTPGPNECRGMVCVPVNTFAGAYAGCSAHLYSGRNTVTKNQANEYTFVIYTDSRTSGIDKLAMGDFNLVPGDVPSVWATNYTSAVNTTTHPNPSPFEQIDYIWWNKGATSASAVSEWCINASSDHCEIQSDSTK